MLAQPARPLDKSLKRFPAYVKERILKRVLEDGKPVSTVCRENGISRKTFYAWKKAWDGASGRGKHSALRLGYKRGPAHPKYLRGKFRHDVLRFIVSHPEWGSRQISRALRVSGKEIGNHAVHTLLVKLDLSRFEQREEFSRLHQTLRVAEEALEARGRRLLPFNRKRLVEAVLLEGKSISQACEAFRVSRRTFYLWKRRYQEARVREEALLEALEDRYSTGFAHPRATPQRLIQQVLDAVVNKPELSVHRLSRALPSVGHHAVQNILERNSLNIFEKRLAYARAQAADVAPVRPVTGWVGRIRQVFEQFLPGRAPAPPPSPRLRRAGPAFFKQLRRSSPYLLSAFLVLFGLFGWGRLLGSAE
ncbi:transposase, partial [Patescibacteria group bacterium]|nr:transposase [Patescibacteria group bacterium]